MNSYILILRDLKKTTLPGDLTQTPPISGLCDGPTGIRVDQSEQSEIAYEPSEEKYNLNEAIHKSILFYEVCLKSYIFTDCNQF